MLTLFKDIFWRDQFGQSQTMGKESKTQKLDRDRYFMGLSLLSTFYFVGLYGGQFLYPSYDSAFMDNNYQVFDLIITLFSPHLYFDPLVLVLCVMLSARAFGRWLAAPVGLISFCNLSIISLAPNLKDMELAHPNVYLTLLIYGVLFLVWLIFQLLMLARSGLKHYQPGHPLVRLNPNLPAKKQFNAIQYMWGFMLLGTALVISSLVFSMALYIFGHYLSMTLVYGAILVITLASLGFSLLIMVKRLRNLNKKPLGWLAALILIPLAFNGLQAFLYEENFFDLMSLFFVMYFAVAFMRFALLIAQVLLLSASYNGGADNAEEKTVTPDAGDASDNSAKLMDELSTAEPAR
ncbi:hypothetical protein [Oceanospirillum sanctuarii]|uniref:hypothetical protein n=1 Tax=Oceanospirillum sanctuarii TaxID=1434821 RepID=UPI000A37DB1D|nr:hypothetical protein [Oceanospirillum sanctuarii]